MPQCHTVTYRSKEAKSQVSPSGASTDPTLHLGAIIGPSYLNSVQLSLSIFIRFLISLVITIPRRHSQTPTPTLLQSDGVKRPLLAIWAPRQTLTTRKLTPQKKPGCLRIRLPSKQRLLRAGYLKPRQHFIPPVPHFAPENFNYRFTAIWYPCSSLPILRRCQGGLQCLPRWNALTSCLLSQWMCHYTPHSNGQNTKSTTQ